MRFILALMALTGPALANDGFGGLTATGLTFGQTSQVAMIDEDLKISPDRISVDYIFHNGSAKDVSGEVIFPLPPIPVNDLLNEEWNLPDDRSAENLVDFKAVVDGTPVDLKIDRVAVVLPDNWADQPAGALYDTPGKDVTALLKQYGLPMSLDGDAAMSAVTALAPEARDKLLAAGVIGNYADDGKSFDLYPNWAIVLRYHWAQTFKAGADTKVHHDYQNRPTGGVFTWQDPPVDDYLKDMVKTYCIDAGTSKALAKAIQRKALPASGDAGSDDTGEGSDDFGMSYDIQYVLKTANSWAGPIKHFRLTLDKGEEANVISLCADGVTKTGPSTFQIDKTDFTPDKDLNILLVEPVKGD